MPPTRRALLIGSPRNGFTCVEPSLDRMRDCLVRNHFTDLTCVRGSSATRAQIVAGFTTLINSTRPEDTVVVYYAGHGALFTDRADALLRSHPLIEPMDIADSDTAHFNGLLGAELRLFTRALAGLCDDVTAIFDCCHAAGLLEPDSATDLAEIDTLAARIGARIHERRTNPTTRTTRSALTSTPGLVRLVGSCASERAYARPGTDLLLFTDTLVEILDEQFPQYPHTWDQIARDLRERVQSVLPEQRPGVEGARDRHPFSKISTPAPADHIHAVHDSGHVRLVSGSAAGIRHGDPFELRAYTGDDAPLARGRVQHLTPFTATLTLARDSASALPRALFARRLRDPTPIPAHLRAADPHILKTLHAELAARGMQLQPPVLDPELPAGQLELHDLTHRTRLPLDDPEALHRAIRRSERWAALHAHLSAPTLGPLAGCYTLTCHQAQAPLRPGATLEPGHPIDLRIHNPGRVSALHVHIYRARADQVIEPWRDVDGGDAIVTGAGFELELRPTLVPTLGHHQHEWLIVALGDGPFDAALTTPAADRPAHRGPGAATRIELFGLPYRLIAAPPR